MLPLLGTILGLAFAFMFNKLLYYVFNGKKISNYMNYQKELPFIVLMILKIKSIMNNKLYLDYLINNYFGIFILKHSYETFYKVIDKGVLEIFIINGLSFSFIKISREYSKNQNGYIFSTLCSVVLGIIFSIVFFNIA